MAAHMVRDNCQIDVDAEFDSHTQSLFDAMAAAFNSLAASARTWQETERRATDMFHERTRARESVARFRLDLDSRTLTC